MAAVLQVGSNKTGLSFNQTLYCVCGNGHAVMREVEAQTQVTYRTAGILSNLWVRVSLNLILDGASTIRVRKNGANGNQVVSFAASTTGTAEDTTNTDSVAAGDELNYSVVIGGTTGNFFPRLLNILFAASSDTVIRHTAMGINSLVVASTTVYIPLAGDSISTVGEGLATFDVNSAGTLKNLFVYIYSNARTTTTTFRSRVNGANGNLAVSVGSTQTGIFEDTANSDTLAANDDVNYSVTTGTGTEAIYWTVVSTELLTTNKKFHSIAGDLSGAAGSGQVANLTRYYHLGGVFAVIISESFFSSAELNIDATASNLYIHVQINTVTAASTFDLRKNAASTAVTISIPALTAGSFEDATNTVGLVPTDAVNYRLVTGATGTSMTFRMMGSMLENTTVTAAVGPLVSPVLMGLSVGVV